MRMFGSGGGWSWLSGGVLALLLSAGGAGATSLQTIQDEITNNGSYVESLGDLTFTFTAVSTAGSVDLTDIDLMLVASAGEGGFDLSFGSGAMAAANGASSDLQLEFTVDSVLGITGGSNAITATVSGPASVSVSEFIAEVPGADLGVADGAPFKAEDFGGTFHSLTIDSKNVVLFSLSGGSAEIHSLEQRFTLVPEPGTAALLALGLAGLAASGTRRPRRGV